MIFDEKQTTLKNEQNNSVSIRLVFNNAEGALPYVKCPLRVFFCLCSKSAVHADALGGDVGSGVRGEKRDHACHFLR